jgi:hypothetical protein
MLITDSRDRNTFISMCIGGGQSRHMIPGILDKKIEIGENGEVYKIFWVLMFSQR